MKKSIFYLSALFLLTSFYLSADQGNEILRQVEERLTGAAAPRDMSARMDMTITRGNDRRERQLLAWTRNNPGGDNWRVMKLQAPADVRGIGLLVLAEDQMYVYLPEFRRVRRIASANRKDAFVGSDFSYEDLSASGFLEFYEARLQSSDEFQHELELQARPNSGKPYSKILMTVSVETMLPVRLRMYDQGGRLWKECTQVSRHIGKYHVVKEFTMLDLQKNSKTMLVLSDIELDQGLDDEIFSERFIKR